jgi:hypothetical protein
METAWYSHELSPVKNVYIDDNLPRNTGLLNAQGKPIYKEPNPIGFGRREGAYITREG